MTPFVQGWRTQAKVIPALVVRELSTRFGRENIGFLWVMAEPLLFAGLVGLMWRFMKGTQEHGISVVAFCVSGYIPLVLFRSSVSRAVGLFKANSSLMYHRQIKIQDFIIARFLVEFIGHMMAYLAIALFLGALGIFPWPYDFAFLIGGWMYYSFFTVAICFVLAPASEISEVLEKFLPVTTYLMIPLSGAFYMAEWLAPEARAVVLYSPPVHGMEMMRYGIFGHDVTPDFEYLYPLTFSAVTTALGLFLCRRVRRTLVVE